MAAVDNDGEPRVARERMRCPRCILRRFHLCRQSVTSCCHIVCCEKHVSFYKVGSIDVIETVDHRPGVSSWRGTVVHSDYSSGYKFAAFGAGPVVPALVYNYFPFKSSNSLEHAKSTLLSGNYVLQINVLAGFRHCCINRT